MFPILRSSLIVLLLLACAVLAGCNGAMTRLPRQDTAEVIGETQKQKQIIAKNYDKEFRRVYRIGYNILRSNADICEKADAETVAYGFGALVRNEDSFGGDMHEPAKQALNLDEFLRIAYIAPNGAAAKAGLQEKDQLVAINGKPVPYGEDADSGFFKLMKSEMNDNHQLTLAVLRGGAKREFSVKLERMCNYNLRMVISPVSNASADGKNVTVYSGIMKDLDTDQKVALIVGHEIAHNIMRHIQKGQGNAMVGAGFGVLIAAVTGVNMTNTMANIGGGMHQVDFEAEADYVGMYLAERAGYDTSNATEVWREMSINNPAAVSHGGDHPANAERFLALEKTVAEIQEKRRKHLPLLPNLAEAKQPEESSSNAIDR